MTTDLTVRQTGILTAFDFTFLRADRIVGRVQFPWYAQANNARLMVHGANSRDGEMKVDLDGVRYRMRHEFTKRAFVNDVRYILIESETGNKVAELEINHKPFVSRPDIALRGPDMKTCSLQIGGNAIWREFTLVSESGQAVIGSIKTAPGLKLRREMIIHSPDLNAHAQAILGALVSFYRF